MGPAPPPRVPCLDAGPSHRCCPNPQSGNYMLDFLVWHERLLYETSEDEALLKRNQSTMFGRATSGLKLGLARFVTSGNH